MNLSPADVSRLSAVNVKSSVSIRGISRVFDGVHAVNNVSLDVQEGEFFSLLGPSGCGKTTLLRIIAGFEEPTAGALYISGEDATYQPPHVRKTNLVFQHGALFPHLNVAQNVSFGLEMKKVAAEERKRRVNEVLELVRLGEFGNRNIDQLSGGQRQRVALARALVNKPKVLLLDEPLSALDLQLRLQMQDELRRLQRQTKATFIFVTHDQGEAIAMSDRLAVMQGGKILQIGTPRDVYQRPSCAFVAQFIGHSNFFKGVVTDVRDGMASVKTDFGFQITGLSTDSVAEGASAVVALRYEKLQVSAATKDRAGLVEGIVVDGTYIGASVRIRVKLRGGQVLVAETSNTATEFGPGTPVELSWTQTSPIVLPHAS